MRKFCKKIFLFLVFMVPLFSCALGDSDMMSDVFQPAKERQGVIYIGDDKKAVGRSLLRESSGYSFGSGFYKEAPLIVKVVYIILRITVVLSITMIIYYSIKFMLQVFGGSELKSATAKKDLINVLIGLLIAMFSITAITLVTSLAKSTFKSNDFGSTNGWSYGNGNLNTTD